MMEAALPIMMAIVQHCRRKRWDLGSRVTVSSRDSGADLPEERCGPCTRAAEGLKGHRMEEVSSVNEILVFRIFSASASPTAWPPVAAVWTMWLSANGSTMVVS